MENTGLQTMGYTDHLETVYRYHDQSKHGFQRFAEGPGYLDWANQPDPFRRYHGAKVIPLPSAAFSIILFMISSA